MRLRPHHLLTAPSRLVAGLNRRVRQAWSPAGRECTRLGQLDRYVPFRTALLRLRYGLGPPVGPDLIEGPDAASFLAMVEEIFGRQIYRFPTSRPAPYIIDAGANVGVSVLFFRASYPTARILAFEADPRLYAYLTRNVAVGDAGRDDGTAAVMLVNKAVWDSEAVLPFLSEGSDAGRATGTVDLAGGRLVYVPAVRLRDYLAEPIDLLKIDIEGAEVRVLADCGDRLLNVCNLFVEYHSPLGQPQELDRLLSLLKTAGFRVAVEASPRDSHPFMSQQQYQGFDMQANIFAYRSTFTDHPVLG